MKDENKIDIIDIYQVEGDKITIKDYDGKHDVFEIKYRENKEKDIKTFQMYANTLEFKDILEIYENKIDKILKLVKKDIEPFFKNVPIIKTVIASPFVLISVLGFISLLLPFSELLIAKNIFIAIFSAITSAVIIMFDKYYKPNIIKKYVPDENLVKSFTNIYTKKQQVKEIYKYYDYIFSLLEKKEIKERKKESKIQIFERKKAKKKKSRKEIAKENFEAYEKSKALHDSKAKNKPDITFERKINEEIEQTLFAKKTNKINIDYEKKEIEKSTKRRISNFRVYINLSKSERIRYYHIARNMGLNSAYSLKSYDLKKLYDSQKGDFLNFSLAEFQDQSIQPNVSYLSKINPNKIITENGIYQIDSLGNVINIDDYEANSKNNKRK